MMVSKSDYPRCATCAYWRVADWRGLYPACTCPKINDYGTPVADDELSYGHQEGGTHYTGPNFGCIHHKAEE